jgi:hypothetical protein
MLKQQCLQQKFQNLRRVALFLFPEQNSKASILEHFLRWEVGHY